MKIGYARVSTQEQNLDRQIENLTAYGAERIYAEKMTGTGTTSKRPEYTRMMDALREGDTLIVDSFSRLSRSTRELLTAVDKIRDKKVHLVSIKENLDTNTPTGRLMMTMLSALSEFERDTIAERTAEGLKAARKRGHNGGRPYAAAVEQRKLVIKAYRSGEMTAEEAGKLAGVSNRTVFRWIEEYDRGKYKKPDKNIKK